eukprot:CAMPEP_0195524310 /NCGR_PEP_ID=MMETSP0794_2-20130614/24047_1 /TAXON_ID=515487 /ORGANISM="Stephanopyxis turris, Strain CCMP 815" /LENGTH=200 /DNA_ID=CAMNT_0040654497 /DNA_START=145 /DNA_END=747 /DNA_ORIENTATION=-
MVGSSNNLPFVTIEEGQFSGIEEEFTEVFRSHADFESFWSKHGGIASPSPSCPEVDFESNMVIGVFGGTKNTGGYSVEVSSVEETETEAIVKYQTKCPPPGGMTIMALTQPYHIVRVAKSLKAVKFEPVVIETLPTYMMGFTDKGRTQEYADKIEKLEIVEKVKVFKWVIFVNFIPGKIGRSKAMDLLKGMEDVEYVEEG